MQPISFLGLPRANVLGVGVHATTMEEAVALSGRLLQSGAQSYVCLTGVHGIMEAQRDPQLLRILNNAALCLPDGMPTVWLGRAQGHQDMTRVYGPDYMARLCQMVIEPGIPSLPIRRKAGRGGTAAPTIGATIPRHRDRRKLLRRRSTGCPAAQERELREQVPLANQTFSGWD